MSMNELIAALLSGGGISYLLGWFSGRKKTKADIRLIEANTEKAEEETDFIRFEKLKDTISIYEMVHEKLKEQLEIVSRKCTELSEKITTLCEENKILTGKINEASLQNILLQKEIHSLRDQLKK